MLEKESQNHEFLVIVDELLDSINSGDIIANKVGVTHCKVNSKKHFSAYMKFENLVGKPEKLESFNSWKVLIEVEQLFSFSHYLKAKHAPQRQKQIQKSWLIYPIKIVRFFYNEYLKK